jgi:hypothetical protein
MPATRTARWFFYWQAGSLPPVIVIHALIDLRALLVWRGPKKVDQTSI